MHPCGRRGDAFGLFPSYWFSHCSAGIGSIMYTSHCKHIYYSPLRRICQILYPFMPHFFDTYLWLIRQHRSVCRNSVSSDNISTEPPFSFWTLHNLVFCFITLSNCIEAKKHKRQFFYTWRCCNRVLLWYNECAKQIIRLLSCPQRAKMQQLMLCGAAVQST